MGRGCAAVNVLVRPANAFANCSSRELNRDAGASGVFSCPGLRPGAGRGGVLRTRFQPTATGPVGVELFPSLGFTVRVEMAANKAQARGGFKQPSSRAFAHPPSDADAPMREKRCLHEKEGKKRVSRCLTAPPGASTCPLGPALPYTQRCVCVRAH